VVVGIDLKGCEKADLVDDRVERTVKGRRRPFRHDV